MRDRDISITMAALLHDVGKVIYKEDGDKRRHSEIGYEYLKNEIKIQDADVLNAVRYHHYHAIKDAHLDSKSIAYIVYIANNISSALDRRDNVEEEGGFEMSPPLQSVFNMLNGNKEECYYLPQMLNLDFGLNFPRKEKIFLGKDFYNQVTGNLSDNLTGAKWTEAYINSILELLEANLSYVPSSAAKNEAVDISLFDHSKITAAVASCMNQYLIFNRVEDYRQALFDNVEKFYGESVFLLASIDISGIQKFIYTISSKGALKTLRTRSFYLEIMMEHIIDALLEKLSLSRGNLVLNGGGHCYFLLPNTPEVKKIYDSYCKEVNDWLLRQFDTDLFVAGAYEPCSALELQNRPDGSYADLYRRLSKKLSSKKINRYQASQILYLNSKKIGDYTRECKICKRIGSVDEEGNCSLCSKLKKFSTAILQEKFFVVMCEEREGALPLPCGYSLLAYSEQGARECIDNDGCFVRCYGKNLMDTGKYAATRIWLGEYSSASKFDELIKESQGISRLGVLRADIDNLGQAVRMGFPEKYNSLSRGAALSRQLSLFFKAYLNHMMDKPEYRGLVEKSEKRNATIVYSGGDDLFIVGAWNDIIELSVDISRQFHQYTEGTLSISAGIGLYGNGYPVSSMADEVAALEDASKNNDGKNSITLNITDETYHWKEFEQKVIGEKYTAVKGFFEHSEDRGKVFLYNLLELIRNQQNDKIYFARFLYLISRLAPKEEAPESEKDLYQRFADHMFHWIQNRVDRKQLETAIILYAYLVRQKEEDKL